MIDFEREYFQKLKFSDDQIDQFVKSGLHDLRIAEESDVPDVTFKFSYDALVKLGIALIARKGYKIRSSPGHHVKIIEKLSQILKDEDVMVLGNKMRQERNINLYDGGYFVGEKDSREYFSFVKGLFERAGMKD